MLRSGRKPVAHTTVVGAGITVSPASGRPSRAPVMRGSRVTPAASTCFIDTRMSGPPRSGNFVATFRPMGVPTVNTLLMNAQ
jgi:hypothetical protein